MEHPYLQRTTQRTILTQCIQRAIYDPRSMDRAIAAAIQMSLAAEHYMRSAQ